MTAQCRTSIVDAAEEMKNAGLLKSTTDVAALTKRAWLDLDGVTDAWMEGVQVARVDRGKPRRLAPAEFAALASRGKLGRSCCSIKE